MSIKYTEAEIYTLNQSMEYMCLYFEQILDHVEQATKTFTNSTSLTGATADAIKCYFTEVHLELILMMKSYVRQLKQRKTLYFDKITFIDPKVNAVIDTNVLDTCMSDATAFRTKWTSMISTFGSIHRDICHLKPVFDEYMYNGGSIMNDLLVGRFDYASNNVSILKLILEAVEEQELTAFLPTLQATRVAIRNLVAELYDKPEWPRETYLPGDLKKVSSYAAANEAESESNNYLISVSAEDSEMRLTNAFADYQEGKLELAVNFMYSGYGAISSAISATKDIALGIATLPACPVLGIALIVKGTGEAGESIDKLHATYKYGVAFANDDIDYEHESLNSMWKDYSTEVLLGGNEDLYEGTGTVTDLAVTYIETYDKTGSTEFAIAYTVIGYVNSEVLVPEATEGYVYAINDITGVDISGTVYEEILGDAVGNVTSKPMDMMADELEITSDSVAKETTTSVDRTLNEIKDTFSITESDDEVPNYTVNPYLQEQMKISEAEAMNNVFGEGYSDLSEDEKVIFHD